MEIREAIVWKNENENIFTRAVKTTNNRLSD